MIGKYVVIDTRLVKEYQNLLKLTNEEISLKSGICPEYYARFFKSGVKRCFKGTAKRLALALGVPAEDILRES